VDGAVRVLGGRIDGVELKFCRTGINDIVVYAGRDNHGETVLGLKFLAIENELGLALIDSNELVVIGVNFGADFFTGLKGHDDELAFRASEEDFAKVGVIEGVFFDIADVASHGMIIHYFIMPWAARMPVAAAPVMLPLKPAASPAT
jgi:hypothetical protein